MDAEPLVVEKGSAIQELSARLVDAESRYLAAGFVLTEHGRYAGLGTGRDLVREITNLQITAARYANPLTLLPGNVPVNEHIERLLRAGGAFVACYCDLDHFKPFNDAYGYRRGDDMIQLTSRILSEICDPRRDFIGHIGGDDFIVLLQSADWATRMREALQRFDQESSRLYSREDLARGGLLAEDRSGNSVIHALSALSIGAVVVEPGDYRSHYEVSVAQPTRSVRRSAPPSSPFIERQARAGLDQGNLRQTTTASRRISQQT
jgi:GGDEF domain-containing protein